METNLVSLTIPTPAPVIDGANTMLAHAMAYIVGDANDYQFVAGQRTKIIDRWNAIEKQRVDLKAPSLEAGRRIDAFFKPALDALIQAKEIATKKLETYDTEQRRIAAEKQREADEKARKEREAIEAAARKARQVQAALEREQERQRQEQALAAEKLKREQAQASEAAERSKRQAAEAAAAGDKKAAELAKHQADEARKAEIIARAAQMKLEQETEDLKAENKRLADLASANIAQLEIQAETTVAPVIKADITEVAGLSRAKVYKWRLIDKSKVKADYLILDEKTINRVVSSAKERAAEIIGGIEVFTETNLRQNR